TVGDAVETRAERLRDHLRRPYRSQQRKLAITTGYTVHRTLPVRHARISWSHVDSGRHRVVPFT
ncbi:hypothetical protein ACU61A_34055, partial [Pseudonocardia sichuanensis]